MEEQILELDPTHQRKVSIANEAWEAWAWLRPGDLNVMWGAPSDEPEEAHP